MPLEYKFGDNVYTHCRKLGAAGDHAGDFELVLALVEGEHDWWVIDDPMGFVEIQRYYREDENISYIYHMFKYQQVHHVAVSP